MALPIVDQDSCHKVKFALAQPGYRFEKEYVERGAVGLEEEDQRQAQRVQKGSVELLEEDQRE